MANTVSTSIGDDGVKKYFIEKFTRPTTKSQCSVRRRYEKRNKKKSWHFFHPIWVFRGMGVPRHRMDKGSLWTGVVLLTLTCGVNSMSSERLMPALIGNADSELQGPSLYTLFRVFYEQQLLRQMRAQQRMDEPTEPEPDPQMAPYIMDIPLQQKRPSSYMNLCHFKICSVGRKRSQAGVYGRFPN